MKATLEFNLPDEAVAHMSAVKGSDAHLCLHELDQWLRGFIKHGEPKDWPNAQEVREMLGAICHGNGVSPIQEY